MRTYLDPVRYVQNRSSGKMGCALAEAAVAEGHAVTVLLGPVSDTMRQKFAPFTVLDYETAAEYERLLAAAFSKCDIFISASAVLDFSAVYSPKKQDRRALFGQSTHSELKLPITAVPDFVERFAKLRRPHQTVIAFAAEVGDANTCIERAYKKLLLKGAQGIFVNPVTPDSGPDGDWNELWFIEPSGKVTSLGRDTKTALATHAWKKILPNILSRTSEPALSCPTEN
jgi:phosphopantothenoylcysteine decarboxylase / phosphopantothenate---cysteine ligase